MDLSAIVRAAVREEQLPLQQLLAQQSQLMAQQVAKQEAFRREIADRLEQHKLGCDARFDDLSFQIATRAALTSSATTASSQQSSMVSGESLDVDSSPEQEIWVNRPGWAISLAPAVPLLPVPEPLPHPSLHAQALSMMQHTGLPAGCYVQGGAHIGNAPASEAEIVSHYKQHTAAPAQPLMIASGIGKAAYNPLQCMLCGKTYKRKRCVLYAVMPSV